MSEAEYKRFIANEPEAWIEYRTLEIYHPQAGTFRFVSQPVDKDFTLEAGAPRDPSTTVTFTKADFEVTEPSENEDNDQVLTVNFNNVDSTVQDILDSINGSGFFTQADVIYRKYYSGDTTAPAVSPLYLATANVNFTRANEASFTAEDINLSTKRVGSLYLTEVFPGLLVG